PASIGSRMYISTTAPVAHARPVRHAFTIAARSPRSDGSIRATSRARLAISPSVESRMRSADDQSACRPSDPAFGGDRVSSARPAVAGDICVLLAPSGPVSGGGAAFIDRLHAALGGEPIAPLHVTFARVPRADAGTL